MLGHKNINDKCKDQFMFNCNSTFYKGTNIMPNVTYDCTAHRNKKIDVTLRKHVLFQLTAEGHKRLEAFLFEKIFKQLVAKFLDETDFTSGWLFQINSRTNNYDWFRLVTPDAEWKELDNQIADFLLDGGCQVVRIDYDYTNREFIGTRVDNTTTQSDKLDSILASMLHTTSMRKEPANYKYINARQQELALKFIDMQLTYSELESLSLSRTLVNCYLYPWYGKQPMDIDAVIVTQQGFRFVEFKRKYPAADGSFGIDEDPHGKLADWLEKRGRSLLHIILVDPLWNKDISPTHLLSVDSKTAEHIVWLGIELVKTVFTTGMYFTYGADSGMTGGNRSQRRINNDAFKVVCTTLKPIEIQGFLVNPNSIKSVNPSNLLMQKRDSGRKVYNI
jgi:hypothetical protein